MLFNALLSIARAAVKAPNAGRFGALVGVLRPLAESSGSGSGLPSDHPALVLAALARELLLLDAASGPALVENDIDDIISLLSPGKICMFAVTWLSLALMCACSFLRSGT